MQGTREVGDWIDTHRDVFLDAVRVYLGVGLILKGLAFVAHAGTLVETMREANLTVATGLLGHYIVAAHVFGGFLLVAGLFTRLAAAVNVPVLVGAVFLVHRREGLFTQEQTLEFAMLVLFLLGVLTLSGSGRLSLDAYVARHHVADPQEA